MPSKLSTEHPPSTVAATRDAQGHGTFSPDATPHTRGMKLHGKDPSAVRRHIRATAPAAQQVQDERTGMSLEALRQDFIDNLHCFQARDERSATPHDLYMALAFTVRDRLIDRWLRTMKTYHEQKAKGVCYLSAEYLTGRNLCKNLVNTGLYDTAQQMLADLGHDLEDLAEQEDEPGLGNGGLGRLAACFLDSMATLDIPAIGYGIRYEFGIFEQEIRDGWQIERPDKWLRFGNPWEIARPEYLVEVKLGGHTEGYTDEQGQYRVKWIPATTVLGTPFDTMVPGYGTETVGTLRLWSARASEEFNLQTFEAGDYTRAVANKTFSENISKVLYPNDSTREGRELRLEQQYFFV
ncbi:MAG TPA: glycogen/starch/alpha-glucan phosphorylase, partial [Candidatus Xenobia bacterium]